VQSFIPDSFSDYEEEWESEKKNIVKAHMIQEQRYQEAFLSLVCVLSCVLLCLPFSVCITFEELAIFGIKFIHYRTTEMFGSFLRLTRITKTYFFKTLS
jgi:hypothetical protein